MLDYDQLDAIMLPLGYQRLRKLVYKATWGNPDAAHYVTFELFRGGDFLTAFFAFRDETIDPIAYQLFKQFSGQPVPAQNLKYKFTMRFHFSGLSPSSNQRALFLPDLTSPELSEIITTDITTKLFPIIKPIKTSHDLYNRLLADEEPCMWYQTNGAIRATYLLHLGHKIGCPLKDVRSALQSHRRLITAGLRVDPDWYLDRVCESISPTKH